MLQYHPLQRLSIYTPIVNTIGYGSSGVTDIRSSSFDAFNMYSLFRSLLKLRNNHENRKKKNNTVGRIFISKLIKIK